MIDAVKELFAKYNGPGLYVALAFLGIAAIAVCVFLYIKHRDVLMYLIFGALTTVVNIVVYWACYEKIRIANVPSDIIAWILSVAFAYITNKLWVFQSKSFERKTLLREMSSFVGARLITGLLDVLIMYLAVDLFHGDGLLWKIISNVIVVILNYIASKLFIFKDGKKDDEVSE